VNFDGADGSIFFAIIIIDDLSSVAFPAAAYNPMVAVKPTGVSEHPHPPSS